MSKSDKRPEKVKPLKRKKVYLEPLATVDDGIDDYFDQLSHEHAEQSVGPLEEKDDSS